MRFTGLKTGRVFTAMAALFGFVALFHGAFSCGVNEGPNDKAAAVTAPLQTITIDDFTFTPKDLYARAGEKIRVLNHDDSAHTVTSESAPDAFDDTGAFDSDTVNGRAEDTITIPEGATVGEKYYFYCDIHQADMKTPNGTITVGAPTTN